MQGAGQDLLSEVIRQLASAGMTWYALALVLVAAFLIVAVRRGWIPKATDPAPPPKMPDVSDVPNAEWGSGLPPDEHPPG